MSKNPRDFRYWILPASALTTPETIALHNQAYRYWCEFWKAEFTRNGLSGDVLHKEDFLRQHYVTGISNGDEIVALHLYSKFDLELLAAREHRYFEKNFNAKFVEKLREDGVRHTLSLEYLTVNPSYRKRELGVSMAIVIINLGCLLQQELGIDASLGACRADNGVNSIFLNFGGTLYDKVDLYNTPVELIALHRNNFRRYPDFTVNSLAEQYWETRTDFSMPLRKVA